jgi:hypothetical protein
VAIAAFWVMTSLVFTVGRWFVPGFEVSGVSDRLGDEATDSAVLQARLFDLQTTMAGPPRLPGAMDVSGALEGRVTLEHLDGLELVEVGPDGEPWPESGCARGDATICHYEIKLRMRADDGTVVLISAGAATPGTEATSGFSLTISAPGLTFDSKAGQCTLGLTAADPFAESPTPWQDGGMRIAGWASCTGLSELRSAATLDLLVAFDAIQQSGF